MSKPRILILENSVAITGALKSIVRSSSFLRESFEFIFVLPKRSQGIPYVKRYGFECIELDMREIRRNFISLLTYLPFLLINTFRLIRLVRVYNIALINVNDFYNLLPALYKILGGKAKYICYVRFRPSKFSGVLVKLWNFLHHRNAARIIAVSKVVSEELPFRKNVTVIPNELPGEEIPFTMPSSNLILYPANFTPGKGQEIALETFQRVAGKYPGWTLRFVGGDMGLSKNSIYKQILQGRAKQLKIENRVEWAGFMDNIIAEYQRAAVVLNFSTSESFSLTCLEAMFCGRPVISTRSGGPEEIIDSPNTGVLVPIGDIVLAAEALDYLLENAGERERMGRAAYVSVRERFDPQKTILPLRNVYFESITGINTN